MNANTRTQRMGWVAAGAFLAVVCAGLAQAAPTISVIARGGSDPQFDQVPTGATGQVWAYSQVQGIKNKTNTAKINGANANNNIIGGGNIKVGGFLGFFTRKFGPTRTTGVLNKAAGNSASIKSKTVGVTILAGTPEATGSGSYEVNAAGTRTDLRTNAIVKVIGAALGQATDPATFTAGSLTMTTTLDQIDLFISAQSVNSVAGYNSFADSTITGLENLYSLSIGITGAPPLSISDVFIEFKSNTLLDIAGFADDADVEDAIRNALALSAEGMVSLSAAFEFAFTVNSTTDFDIDFGQNNFAMLVPVPASGVLAGVALACGGGLRRRRRAV